MLQNLFYRCLCICREAEVKTFKCGSEYSNSAIFKLFHLIAHTNYLLNFCRSPKIYFFADLTKNRYDLDLFISEGYCCVGFCHFFYPTIWVKAGQCSWLNCQVSHVLKFLAAYGLKIASLIWSFFTYYFHSILFYTSFLRNLASTVAVQVLISWLSGFESLLTVLFLSLVFNYFAFLTNFRVWWNWHLEYTLWTCIQNPQFMCKKLKVCFI